jgi:hypothetical protein
MPGIVVRSMPARHRTSAKRGCEGSGPSLPMEDKGSDYIIVGAGAAACVLADRLSADRRAASR